MSKLALCICIILAALLGFGFVGQWSIYKSEHLSEIPASDQRSGDADKGRDYLYYGDYVDAGFPMKGDQLFMGIRSEEENELNRDGINGSIPHDFTAFTNKDGVTMVGPNCMQCHAGRLGDSLILGLGNSSYDFTVDRGAVGGLADQMVKQQYRSESKEWKAYEPFSKALKSTARHLVTDVVGVNPADKLAAVLASHRDPEDLSWIDEPQMEIPEHVVPTDVPAWWLLRKKNAMFYTGVGRGDFARLMMASSLLTMQDSSRARDIDNRFADVKEFVISIEAPTYTEKIDLVKAASGESIFNNTCSKCHGKYGEDESYPNYLVDLELIQTDSLLVTSNFAYSEFVDWYNMSWFAQGEHGAYLKPSHGYVAPPLDGVWATAPYLHNGSVPTIYHLLKSESRPEYWSRSFLPEDYNYKEVGWKYESRKGKYDKYTYDTTKPGYRNTGHYFGDKLSEEERWQVIEYLKTL